MNTPTRTATGLLALSLVLALTGCGGKSAAPATGNDSPAVAAPAPSSAPATGKGDTTTTPAPAATPAPAPDAGSTCLVALPDATPTGFTQVGRQVLSNKNATWNLTDADKNNYLVSISYKASTAEVSKYLDTVKSLYDNPKLSEAKFNGCDALQRVGKSGSDAEIRVIYVRDTAVVQLTATGKTASLDKLAVVGRGGGRVAN